MRQNPYLFVAILFFLNICCFAATYTVTNTLDAGAGSLRQAITDANDLTPATNDVINFNIVGAGPHTITLATALPPLTDNQGVTIDGTTQTGWAANTVLPKNATSASPMNATLKIIITHAIAATQGIVVSSNNNVIKGIVMQNIATAPIDIADIAIDISGNNNQVLGCIIGLDAGGTTSSNTLNYGIKITGNSNIIGDGTAAGANIISGNSINGIWITSASATGNIIKGNMIGLQKDGISLTANTQRYGIYFLTDANSNTVGGTGAGDANVISGNADYGIAYNQSHANVVYGNIIGPATSGTTSLGATNQDYGIYIENSYNTIIGGTSSAHRNVISDNTSKGILLNSATTTGTSVLGNYIGIAADGTSAITSSSQDIGVSIETSAVFNYIGGTNAGEGNLISGNNNGSSNGKGIYLVQSWSNVIQGNIIGLQKDGSTWLSNEQATGIDLTRTYNNIVGGNSSAHRNIISGNGTNGIYLSHSVATGNIIKGNYIGLQSNGTSAVTGSSQNYGVYITSSANNNIIGGTAAGEANVISGNTETGVYTNSSGSNNIYGNIIGLDYTGTAGITTPSQGKGIHISSSPSNTIGGVNSTYRNIITGNGSSGIYVEGASSTGNSIKANYIGVDISGINDITNPAQNAGIDIGDGITAITSSNIVIGSSASGEGNLISGNNQYGIILNTNVSGVIIKGNILGVQSDGNTLVTGASQDYGIHMGNSHNNTVGGTAAGEKNIISGNTEAGISLSGASVSGNTISGNYIGPRSTGTAAVTSGSQDYGIFSANQSHSNTIHANLISANTVYGIYLWSSSIGSNTITANTIGPQINGTSNIGVQQTGIYINNNPGNIIGGASSTLRNTISAHLTHGIYLTNANSTGTLIQGNYIGIGSNGTSFIASNSQDYGIYLESTAPPTTIGGSNAGEGNVISGNGAGTAYGIRLDNTGNSIFGNYIGPKATGTTVLDATNNQEYGIYITSRDNIIGGATSGHRNVISDNTNTGIYITGASTTGNQIKGNYIGLASDGATAISTNSQDYGIQIVTNANKNTIGGTAANEGNVISGNSSSGIYITSGTGTNYIYQNIIGPTSTGLDWVTDNPQQIGINIVTSASNVIGGVTSGHRNIISGNESYGISNNVGTTIIKGNYIGPNINGTAILTGTPTQDYGISCSNTVIGGTAAGEGNVISGNHDGASGGAGIIGTFSVFGNVIGPQADGTSYLTGGSQFTGIDITAGGGTIGGSTPGARNIISGNQVSGIYASDGGNGSIIQGNYIGLTSDGTSTLSTRQTYGIWVLGNNLGGAVTIGGTNAGEGNIISGNANSGIYSQVVISTLKIYGNTIGPAADGASVPLVGSNQTYGIRLGASGLNVIGGASAGSGNTISANTTYGIHFAGLFSQQNVIKGNYIGLATDGTSAIPSSPQDYGIYITTNSITNTIGGSVAGERNKIAYNTADGIYISGASTSGNLISRNLIYGNTDKAINLNSTGNNNYSAPTVDKDFTSTTASGTAAAGDIIEVFESIISSSVTADDVCQSAEVYLGTTTANGSGIWSLTFGSTLSANGTPIATATHPSDNNTSEFGCPEYISLPIELMRFNAKKINNTTVNTYWQTATEINNDFFTVEASYDPSQGEMSWQKVGTVPGAANSTVVQNYSLTDYSPPFVKGKGWAYYRLKQTDFDGTHSYSNIVAVSVESNAIEGFSVYPNPAEGDNINVLLKGELNKEVLIVVRDVLGKELYSKVFITDSEEMNVRISDGFFLPAGLYTIIASNDDILVSKKIIVK